MVTWNPQWRADVNYIFLKCCQRVGVVNIICKDHHKNVTTRVLTVRLPTTHHLKQCTINNHNLMVWCSKKITFTNFQLFSRPRSRLTSHCVLCEGGSNIVLCSEAIISAELLFNIVYRLLLLYCCWFIHSLGFPYQLPRNNIKLYYTTANQQQSTLKGEKNNFHEHLNWTGF